METAMQKFAREKQEKDKATQGSNTYVPGAVLPESGVKADDVVDTVVAANTPVNINAADAQVDPAASKHSDGIAGQTVDGRGNPVVSAEVLKAKARAKEKEMKQLKPVVKTKYLLYSLKPGLGFFVGNSNKRHQFIGNYLGTDDVTVKDYALQTLSKYVSEVKEEASEVSEASVVTK